MKLSKVREILDATVYTGQDQLEVVEVMEACGSDLMSDVLAFVKEQGMLLTGLQNSQVVRTAEMMDMEAIVFVRGKVPNDEMITIAQTKGIVLMTTDYPMFTACGLLYSGGLAGGKVWCVSE